jgi:ABC-type multidrug transport system fused ATPase/permease subunit
MVGLLLVLGCLFNILFSKFGITYIIKANTLLHNQKFIKIIKAKVNLFWKYPVGYYINRFSNDMSSIDAFIWVYTYEVIVAISFCMMLIMGCIGITLHLIFGCILASLTLYIIFHKYN